MLTSCRSVFPPWRRWPPRAALAPDRPGNLTLGLLEVEDTRLLATSPGLSPQKMLSESYDPGAVMQALTPESGGLSETGLGLGEKTRTCREFEVRGHLRLLSLDPVLDTEYLGGGGVLEAKMLSQGNWGEAGGPRGLRASVAAPNPAFDTGRRAPRALAAGGKACARGLGWARSL